MVGKLITHSSDRKTAILKMQEALDSFVIRGFSHNVTFLNSVLNHAKFIEGDLTTDFIKENYPNGFDSTICCKYTREILIAVGSLAHITEIK